MREILFKAKRLDNGEWVEGYYVRRAMGLVDEHGCFCPTYSYRIYWTDEGRQSFCAVDHETLCQYTGLTDSNGVMIFEGDILEYKDNYTSTTSCTVEFLRSAFMAVWPNDWDNEILDKGFSKYAKVIGNIHDKEK